MLVLEANFVGEEIQIHPSETRIFVPSTGQQQECAIRFYQSLAKFSQFGTTSAVGARAKDYIGLGGSRRLVLLLHLVVLWCNLAACFQCSFLAVDWTAVLRSQDVLSTALL